MPGQFAFSVRAGDTFSRTVTWKDAAGAPVDLTGYAAEFTVTDSAGAVVLALTVGQGVTLGGAAGTVALAAQTAGTAPGGYSYFLRLTSPGGVVTTILVGAFDLTA